MDQSNKLAHLLCRTITVITVTITISWTDIMQEGLFYGGCSSLQE